MKHYESGQKNTMAVRFAMSLLLAILTAASAYTLIHASNGVLSGININKNAQANSRTIISYITATLHQNDINGALTIKAVSDAGRNALGVNGDVWIYYEDGCLMESRINESGGVDKVKIAEIKDFIITYNQQYNLITSSVLYEYAGEDRVDQTSVYMRSPVAIIDYNAE